MFGLHIRFHNSEVVTEDLESGSERVLLGNKSHKNICWEASKTVTWRIRVETGAVIYGIIYGGHTNNLGPVNNFLLFNNTTS